MQSHAARGKRSRSKTGAICAYKLGALDGRSARLHFEFGRQNWMRVVRPRKKSCQRAPNVTNWQPEPTKAQYLTQTESSRSVECPKFTENIVQSRHTLGPLNPSRKIQITSTDWYQVSIGLVPGLWGIRNSGIEGCRTIPRYYTIGWPNLELVDYR